MNKLSLTCPHCNKITELKVESISAMLIMNCPQCRTLILYNQNNSYNIKKEEIKDLVKLKKLKTIHELLSALSIKKSNTDKIQIYKPQKISTIAGKPDRDNSISKNDILDLVIDLNTSDSVSDFLKKIDE